MVIFSSKILYLKIDDLKIDEKEELESGSKLTWIVLIVNNSELNCSTFNSCFDALRVPTISINLLM